MSELALPTGPRRILLVEDDLDLREALEDSLGARGHAVVTAADGAEGLRQMREFRPDVVVLDLMMARCDGWQFRVEQRQDPDLASTPVVVISANGSAHAAAVDADLYVRKPFEPVQLADAIDHVLAERERRLAPIRIAQTERLAALGTLAAGIAHEINNPLTYVLLQLAQARRLLGTKPEGGPELVHRVDALLADALEGAERIEGVTRAMRLFAQPPRDTTALVDVRAALDAALRLVNNDLCRRARVVTRYSDPPLVRADETLLGQVFLNLLTNAAQALPDDDAAGNEVQVRAGADADGNLVVEVEDSGPGVPSHLRARVFEPFFSTKPFGQGTGLGLWISHNIVTGLGGTIGIHGDDGRGATFRVVIPSARAAA
jgi:C4-dicarboxylate-specific signal transduction histidine kinase